MSSRLSISNPTARLVAEHPGAVKLGRVGWAAKGVVYTIAGILATAVVFASFGWSATATQEASPNGALKTLAGSPGGAALLWVLGASMLLYSAWRLVSALMPGGHDAEASAKRVGFVVSAVIYATFAVTAISLTRSGGGATDPAAANGNTKVSNLTARVMHEGGGRMVIGVIGAIVIGAGVYRLVKGVRGDVDDELDRTGVSGERWLLRLGAIGEIGRGIAIGLIGFFLVRAAITFDPDQATGLDGALRRLAVETWGTLVVAIIAIGFVAYGMFCLATCTHRRLQAP
jgi:hypothetical protein